LRKCQQSEKSDWKNNITKISPSSYSKAWRIISTCMEQNLKDSGNQGSAREKPKINFSLKPKWWIIILSNASDETI
jgi:hypothetical protein